jgi:hypothetical protein
MERKRMTAAEARNRRRYVRHPASIPVSTQKLGHSPASSARLRDISSGGLAFVSEYCYTPGDILCLNFPTLRHPGSVIGQVVWSASRDGGETLRKYVNGVRFQGEGARLRARVLEQMSRIERYYAVQSAAGRTMTLNEAATEWIRREADRFPL